MAAEHVVWKNQVLIVDGQIVTYEIAVNSLLLEEQARKAARNRGGRSRDGALVIRVTQRRALKGKVSDGA